MSRKQPSTPATVPSEVFKQLWKAAPSLKPTRSMIEHAAVGEPYAVAIRDAWRFDPEKMRIKVQKLSTQEYAELISRYEGLTFNG